MFGMRAFVYLERYGCRGSISIKKMRVLDLQEEYTLSQ